MKGLLAAMLILLTSTTFAQTTTIFVAVAKIKTDKKCSSTDLPDYEIVAGTTPGTALGRQAKETLQKKYEEKYKNNDLFIEVTGNSSDSYGNFLTIISTTQNSNGCKQFLYGIGFGKNKEESLKKAVKRLESILWNGGKKFTYKIVRQEEITETTAADKSSEAEIKKEEKVEEKELDKLKHKS